MAKLRAEYFTDPLCSWSWGNEPHYRKLREEFGGQIEWRHRMGGLMEKQLTRGEAEALAKHQEEASLETKMPVDAGFWLENPPSSSYPACIAVKAAGLQGAEFEDLYLRRVREGFLTLRQRLDTKKALVELAEGVSCLDPDQMAEDIEGDAAKQAFREDWEATRSPVPEARDTTFAEGYKRYSFPALLLFNESGEYRVLDGDNTYQDYLTAIKELDSRVRRGASPSVEAFVRKYRHVATKEVVAACEVSWGEAEAELEKMARSSFLRKRPVGHFCMWEWIG